MTEIAFTMNITNQGDNLYEDQITFTCITGYELNSDDLVRRSMFSPIHCLDRFRCLEN